VIFFGTVLLVLLSACAHLGNMLLVRGLRRQHEFTIRTAIGASRSRLIRQLVTENVLLSVLGSAAALFVGFNTARLVLLSGDTPFDVAIHWQTVVACVAMIFVSVFIFGLPSAREMTRLGFQTSTLKSKFLANQIAVSCVLLIISGVFAARGLFNALVDLKFDYRNIAVVDPGFHVREGTPDAFQGRLDALASKFLELALIESVTIATAVPLRGGVGDNYPEFPRVTRSAVAPSFFDVMRLPIVRGRTFVYGEQDVAIASESAARSLWPDQDPLGQSWTVGGVKRTVVGVVQESGEHDVDPSRVDAYVPISERDIAQRLLVVRTRTDPSSVVGMMPRAVLELDETVSVTTMDAMIENRRRYTLGAGTELFAPSALIATMLAAAGIFALITFTVVQRSREFGIRIAMGATRRDLLSALLTQEFKPLLLGVIKGSLAGVVLLLFIRVFSYPIPYAMLLAGLALGITAISAVAIISTLIPAMRALRIDPSKALRAE